MGHRHSSGWAGRAARAGLGEAGRRDLHGEMRGLPWRVRRKRRPLAATLRRCRLDRVARSGEDSGLLFRQRLDRARLCPSRHAVRRRAVADQ